MGARYGLVYSDSGMFVLLGEGAVSRGGLVRSLMINVSSVTFTGIINAR